MHTTFYVTTQEIETGREHNYRLPQGDSLPENHTLKTQRPAGNFPLRDSLSPESKDLLSAIK